MSIRRKMLVLFSGFLLVSLVLTFFSSRLTGKNLKSQVEETGMTLVEEISSSVDEYFSKLLSLTASLGVSLSAIEPKSRQEYIDLFALYLKSAQTHGVQTVFMGFESKEFVDSTGWEPPEGYDPRPRSWYRETLENDGVTVTSPYVDLITKKLIVSITVPIRAGDGSIFGVAGLDVSLEHVREKLLSKRLFGGGFPFLVERSGGGFLASPFDEWGLTESVTRRSEAVPAELADVGESILSQESGLLRLDFRGERMILFHSPAGGYFAFALLFPESVLDGFIREVSSLHILGGLAIILFAMAMLLPLAREIGRSFSRLSTTVDRITLKLSNNRDFTETAYNIHMLAEEVGESLEKASLDEFRRFLESMENALLTIGRQGEEIAALTEQAIAIQDNLTEANRELNRRQVIWKNTLVVMETITTSGETSKSLQYIAESIRQSSGAFGGMIRRCEGDSLRVAAFAGYGDGPLIDDVSRPYHNGYVEKAYKEGVPIWTENVSLNEDYIPIHPDVVSVVEIPLRHGGRTNGVLEVAFDREIARSNEFIETLLPVATALGSLIEVESAHLEIKDSYRFLVRKLQSVTELYHLETADHMDRIGAYSRLAARCLGRTQEEQDDIEVFSRLHDIGKLRIPISILAKPGALSDEEMEIVHTHPLWGAELIGGASWLDMARNICLTHHEKWDGSGYPLGLAGDEIPWEGQVVALADVYDALRSHRVYKDALSHEEAVGVIMEGDGRTVPEHFSPRILQFFREHHEEMNELFVMYSKLSSR